jgi:hypothetical protein
MVQQCIGAANQTVAAFSQANGLESGLGVSGPA